MFVYLVGIITNHFEENKILKNVRAKCLNLSVHIIVLDTMDYFNFSTILLLNFNNRPLRDYTLRLVKKPPPLPATHTRTHVHWKIPYV